MEPETKKDFYHEIDSRDFELRLYELFFVYIKNTTVSRPSSTRCIGFLSPSSDTLSGSLRSNILCENQ